MRPLGLYVHLPWCVRKCPYCDFNSHPLRGDLPAEDYIRALLADLQQWQERMGDRPVTSVFFGGGTPSLFSGCQIAAVLEGIAAQVRLSETPEVTLEANPGTIERDAFDAYRAAGVNRVSLGVQSFDDRALERLGRIHGRADVERAIDSLRQAGMDNFNIDLMYGLPGQSAAAALEDVRLALSAGPSHISHYQLTLEPNTAFANDPPNLPDEDHCWDMQEAAAELLGKAGFHPYEVSAWARPGRECRHNINYWRYGDFVGIGAGAHGKLTNPQSGEVLRWSMPRQPRVYLARPEAADLRILDERETEFEFFLNRLRLREAFLADDFEAATGLPWSRVEGRVQSALARGLIDENGGAYTVSELGRRFLNDVQQIFLP